MFALMICATASVAFGQLGVADPAKATIDCPADECHVAPYFKGEGGFIGEIADGFDEVAFVVDCGIVNTTGTAEPNPDGIVAELLVTDNGLACADGGTVEIHGLMDGGWYWINDEKNSAVASLIAKDALGNAGTAPADPGGTDITLDTPKDGMTSIVKQASTGRIGILHHILPEPEAAAADMCGPVFNSGRYRYEQNDSECMLGDGSTKIVLTADTTDSLGRVRRVAGSVHRRVANARTNEVRVGFGLYGADGQAHITTDTSSNASIIKGYDMGVPGGIAAPEPFLGDYTVWLIEGEGRNLTISDADIQVDPARRVVKMVPGPDNPGTPAGTDTEMLPVTHDTTAGAGCMPSGEDDEMCTPVVELDTTRRLEAGYFMGEAEVARCRQKHYAHSDDSSRNAVNAFKGVDGEEVLVLNEDYANDTDTNFDESTLNLALDLPRANGGALAELERWVGVWNSRPGNQDDRISVVQVEDGTANDGGDSPVLDDNVFRDIPEVVCETWERTFDVPATDPTPGPDVEQVVIETAGIVIGPAADEHCRSGRADVARLFIGVTQDEVHKHSPEIIPKASRAARINGMNFAAYTTLNVMCPSSSANQAHHAKLNGGRDLVPGVE